MNLNISTLSKWIKKKWRPIILISILLLYIAPKILKLNQDVYYEDKNFVSKKIDSVKNMQFSAYIKTKVSTKDAFMPHESIHIDVEVTLLDPLLIKDALTDRYFIRIFQANFTDTAAYANNRIGDIIPSKFWYYDDKNTGSITIKLSMSRSPDKLSGSADIYFTKSGSYEMLLGNINKPLFITKLNDIKIDGSSVDIMNKKTNDILYLIAIINFVFLIYQEFFKDKRLPKQSP